MIDLKVKNKVFVRRRNYLASSLFLLISSFISCLKAQNQEPVLQFIIEPYLQQVSDSTFNVLWETSIPAKGAVRFGVAEFNVLRPDLNRFFSEKDFVEYHNVKITGLKADEFYFYQAISISISGDTLEGPVTPLHIPDYSRMPVSFAVIGDTQNSPEIWGKLSELIYQERPSFIIHVGDLVQYGPHKDDWVDEFFKPSKDLLRFYPIYPAIGNHEMNNEWYYCYFDLPSPEWFYTVKKGDVLFIFVDTNKDILPGSEQYQLLEKTLASASEKWKVMVHHHPVYVSEEGFYGNTWFQRAVHGDPNEMHLKRLYETYGVDLELNGHAHFYERTWPLKDDRVDMGNGVTYITTGGGNDGFSKHAANKAWYDARTRVGNHFLYISIAGNTFYGRAIDSTGNVFDYWTIQKKSGQYLNTPYMSGKQYFIDFSTVKIQNMNSVGYINYYMGNENYSTGESKEITLNISQSTTISSTIYDSDNQSRQVIKKFEKLPLLPALKKGNKAVVAEYYEGNWNALPDFNILKPIKTFKIDSVKLSLIQPRAKDHFAVRFSGSFSIPKTDVYRFMVESFDGSRLIIDGNEIINNDGIHYEIKKENYVALEKGMHNFEIHYFDFVRRETLKIFIGNENGIMNDFNSMLNSE